MASNAPHDGPPSWAGKLHGAGVNRALPFGSRPRRLSPHDSVHRGQRLVRWRTGPVRQLQGSNACAET